MFGDLLFGGYFGIIFLYLLFAVVFGFLSYVLVIRYIIRLIKGEVKRKPIGAKNWYLQLSLSREDGLSQWFYLLALGFFGVTFVTFNRNLGEPLEWYTILLIVSLLGFVMSYYLKLIYTLGFSIIGLLVWWVVQAATWADPNGIQASGVFASIGWFALLVIVVGTLHETRLQLKRAATVYEVFGIIMMAGILFFLSSNSGLTTLEGFSKGKPFYGSWQLSVSFLLMFGSLAASLVYGVWKKLTHTQEALAAGIFAILFLVIAFMPPMTLRETSYSYYSSSAGSLSGEGAIWAMVFNVLTLLGLLSVMLAGNLRRESWQINLGAVLLFIYIAIKYFDWFYTFLDKSVFFIVAGVLFFVIGWIMERSRKRLIEKITVN